ncbi:hypothetical protein DFS28_104166 [Pseudomonas sp. 478]|jgi:asparagine N-glycosylation enzyme membrane subunit Stt3|nr:MULTISPECIES: hypothetical protein [unclassified Pseudomonas]PZW98044.1 hypothetical protein DFS28_104166 [Pseudomonas sp. 478]TCV56738.1 hypothetical protein EDB99_101237 [Pseudomonas sp. 460]
MIGLISLAYAVKELGKRAPSFDGMLVAVMLLFWTLLLSSAAMLNYLLPYNAAVYCKSPALPYWA